MKPSDFSLLILLRTTLIWITLTLSGQTVANTQAINLPDLGAPDLSLYDPQTEVKFGQAFVKSLNTEFSLNKDLEINDYIRQIGHKVALNSGQNRAFRFYVIENSSINAFAGPNGVIGIHTGLIKATKTEAELASVIAHEIAHITQQHLSRRYLYNSTQGSATSVATLLAAILIGMVDPSAGMATLMAGQSFGIEKQLSNSRQHENEADFVGIKILHDSGYNAHAMADFFGRLAEASRNNEFQTPEILRTHPVTANRLVNAKNRARSLLPIQKNSTSDPLVLMKLRLNHLHKLKDWVFNQSQTSLTDRQACYQLNLIEMAKTQPSSKHLDCLIKASNQELEHPFYTNLLLDRFSSLPKKLLDQQTEQINQVLKMARFHIQMHPQKNATLIKASQLLTSRGKVTKAIEFFKDNHHNSIYFYAKQNKLAEFYNAHNNSILAYLHQAKAQQAIFNFQASKHFFKQAKKLSEQKNGQYKVQLEKFFTKYGDTFKKTEESTP